MTAYLGWECKFSEIPDQVGQLSQQSCVPYTRNHSFESFILQAHKQKTVTAAITLLGKHEETIASNCVGNEPESYLLNFSQGVGGKLGEDDFELTLGFDNNQTVINSSSGLISGDILYCPKKGETSVKLTVDATERDLISDDIYPRATANINLVDGSVQDVTFGRRKSTMSILTAKKSILKVKVQALGSKKAASGLQ